MEPKKSFLLGTFHGFFLFERFKERAETLCKAEDGL